MFTKTQITILLSLVAALALVNSMAFGIDIDQNGVEDNVEKIWAERYKPSFIVNQIGAQTKKTPNGVSKMEKRGLGQRCQVCQ